MPNKMKTVPNPLTIIGLYCGVVEVVSLIVIRVGRTTPNAQPELIQFVIWFPVSLVLLFFGTLWFKDRVLYAPSDIKNEEHYLVLALASARQGLAADTFRGMLNDAIPKIASEVAKTVSNGSVEASKIQEIVQNKLQPVQSFAYGLKASSSQVLAVNHQQGVFQLLYNESKPMTLKEIAKKFGRTEYYVSAILFMLISSGIVKEHPDEGNGIRYSAKQVRKNFAGYR
jgi:predicted transcriptional regulator